MWHDQHYLPTNRKNRCSTCGGDHRSSFLAQVKIMTKHLVRGFETAYSGGSLWLFCWSVWGLLFRELDRIRAYAEAAPTRSKLVFFIEILWFSSSSTFVFVDSPIHSTWKSEIKNEVEGELNWEWAVDHENKISHILIVSAAMWLLSSGTVPRRVSTPPRWALPAQFCTPPCSRTVPGRSLLSTSLC